MSLNPCCGGRCSSTSSGLSKVNAMLVLILVVVEDVLVRMELGMKLSSAMSLNPCCGGRCSSTVKLQLLMLVYMCLNPCCGGRCSSTCVA